MNRFFGIGRATATPELEQTNSGVAYTRFGIAIDRNYKDQDGEKITDFLNVVAWRGLAENCAKYIEKGRQIAVVGTVNTRTYTGQDGVKRTVTEIVADNVEFLGSASKTADKPNSRPKIDELREIEDDDLPF